MICKYVHTILKIDWESFFPDSIVKLRVLKRVKKFLKICQKVTLHKHQKSSS